MLLAQCLTLVEFLLASCQCDFRLDSTVFEIQAQRNDGETLGLALTSQLVDLRRVKQQLTLALRGMIVPRSVEIFGNIGSLKPHFTATVDGNERFGQRCAAFSKRLHLSAGQHQTGFILVFNGIVVACLLVLRNRLHALLLGHVGPPFRFFKEVFCNATIDNIMGARRPTIQAARSRDTTLKESSNAP